MRITLRQLELFAAVAGAGSTAAAGGEVSLSQSAVSAAVNDLELSLGFQLFDRVGKKLVLVDEQIGNSHGVMKAVSEFKVDGCHRRPEPDAQPEFAALSRLLVQEMLDRRTLVELVTELPPMIRPLYVVIHPERDLSEALASFLQ